MKLCVCRTERLRDGTPGVELLGENLLDVAMTSAQEELAYIKGGCPTVVDRRLLMMMIICL